MLAIAGLLALGTLLLVVLMIGISDLSDVDELDPPRVSPKSWLTVGDEVANASESRRMSDRRSHERPTEVWD